MVKTRLVTIISDVSMVSVCTLHTTVSTFWSVMSSQTQERWNKQQLLLSFRGSFFLSLSLSLAVHTPFKLKTTLPPRVTHGSASCLYALPFLMLSLSLPSLSLSFCACLSLLGHPHLWEAFKQLLLRICPRRAQGACGYTGIVLGGR